MHLLELGEHLAGVAQQGLAGAGEADAAGLALEQGGADGVFQRADAVAGRRGCQVGPLGPAGEVAGLGNGHEEA